jgi:hypothetical protein
MKPKRTQKPVHKCHACELNLGERCGVYALPRKMWDHHICPGYKNEDMLADYKAEIARHQEDPHRKIRKETAVLRNSEDHHQGTLPLANR